MSEINDKGTGMNNDTISRAEVHDLLATWLSDKLDEKTREVLEVIDGKVEDMPSVTPKQEPCKDTVSLGVFEQVMWERDVAIEQLKELGYGFGEKPRTGHWIYDRTRDWDGECKYECSECGMGSDVDYAYCMRCGAKMVEPWESEKV